MTKKVYEFHRNIEYKWGDEAVFLVCAYLPVYAIAVLGDTIIFNSIEFWTDSNPLLTDKSDRPVRVAKYGDMKAIMSYDRKTDTIKVDTFKSDVPVSSFMLARTDSGVVMKGPDGAVIAVSSKGTDGSVSLKDADGHLVKRFSPEAVRIAKQRRGSYELACPARGSIVL